MFRMIAVCCLKISYFLWFKQRWDIMIRQRERVCVCGWLSPLPRPLSSTQLTSVWSRRLGYWLVIFRKTLYSHSPQYWDMNVIRLGFIHTAHSVPQGQGRYRSANLWREADDCIYEHNSANTIGHRLMCCLING